MVRGRRRHTPVPEERGAYLDHTGRWAWTVDSKGQHSVIYEVPSDVDPEEFASGLQTELDEHDPIPASAFVPAPLYPRLRLL